MRRLPNLMLALLASALLVGALASPASAEHPEYEPTPFEVGQTGEDLCTYYYTEGLASWSSSHSPEETPSVRIEGKGAVLPPPPSQYCLHVVPYPRQIKFVGHVQDWAAVEHVEPFDRPDVGPYVPRSFEYAFSLNAPGSTPIEYVTVAICTVADSSAGGAHQERCGEPVLVEPGGTPGPEDPYCTFDFGVVNDWGNGYQGQVVITADEPITDWRVVMTFPGGQYISSIWNANVSQSGSTAVITPPSWHSGSGAYSVTVGFIVSGSSQPPPLIDAWANGRECAAA